MKYISQRYEACNTLNIDFIFITATDIETQALHAAMNQNEQLKKVECDSSCFYIGKLGLYTIVHTQCREMGAVSTGGSILTVTKSVEKWPQAKAVIMVGICFGINEDKQHYGDILISDSIIPYEVCRVGAEEKYRGRPISANRDLVYRFKTISSSWQGVNYKQEQVKISICPILSGEKLVDNIALRNKLAEIFPSAQGGEMEGIGIGSACEERRIPWVIVKGICDFADGQKGQDKDIKQKDAARLAVSCCIEALTTESAFERIDIKRQPLSTATIIKGDVLFDIYRPEHEAFYINRKIDNIISRELTQMGIWVSGASGVGKTSALLRNLIQSKKNYILINLAICIDLTVDECFQQIYHDIAVKYGSECLHTIHNFRECTREIITILAKNKVFGDLHIVLEEIPLGDENKSEFAEFVKKIGAFIISCQQEAAINVRFILSTITSPTPLIPSFQTKIKENLFFLNLEKWTLDECILLMEKIATELDISIPPSIYSQIIEQLEYLPRNIKRFFKQVYMRNMKVVNPSDIASIIREM